VAVAQTVQQVQAAVVVVVGPGTQVAVAVVVLGFWVKALAGQGESVLRAHIPAQVEAVVAQGLLGIQVAPAVVAVVFMAGEEGKAVEERGMAQVVLERFASSGPEQRAHSQALTRGTCNGTLHPHKRRSAVRASHFWRQLSSSLPFY
jgi:hypothetical protein